MLFDQIWLGSYMSGGVGFTQYATAAYTDNILDGLHRSTVLTTSRRNTVASERQSRPRTPSLTSQPRSTSTVWSSTRATDCPREPLRRFPACIRLAAASGISCAMATANSNAGLNGWYLSHAHAQGRLVTSRLLRLRPAGPGGSANCMSIRPDEGLLGELRGTELPQLCNERRTPGRIRRNRRLRPHCTWRRLDPVPLMKITFADPSLKLISPKSAASLPKGADPRVHARRRALTDASQQG